MSVTLRGWREEDLEPFARPNADPGVMRHFPSVSTRAESDALAERFVAAHRARGVGVQVLDVEGFAGIVGWQECGDFEHPLLPPAHHLRRHVFARRTNPRR